MGALHLSLKSVLPSVYLVSGQPLRSEEQTSVLSLAPVAYWGSCSKERLSLVPGLTEVPMHTPCLETTGIHKGLNFESFIWHFVPDSPTFSKTFQNRSPQSSFSRPCWLCALSLSGV